MTQVNIEVGYQDTKDPGELARATRWTEEATGHKYWTYAVELDAVRPIEQVAEAVYMADNYPGELKLTGLSGQVRAAMIEVYEHTSERHHSLSVGDRVRVGEVEVVCASAGWQRVRA
jgi:hypothetical protein